MSAGDRGPDSGDDSRLEKIEPSLPRVIQDVKEEDTDSPALHPSVYVVIWISLSSSVILFNKWILDSQEFRYPVLLTAWHLFFATVMTQIMARTTTLLDGRKNVRMNTRMYIRTILPIGIVYSLSLICGNLTYLYLSVAFIQMLKATTPVAVLITGWFFGVQKPNMRVLFNVSFIVIGVVLASFGEIKFVMLGFLFQCGGIMFEAVRLVMVQRLLNSPDSKMDPLVSLYYFAPVCTVFNGLIALAWEVPKVSMEEVHKVGLHNFALNAMVAFALNVSVVFLIGKTSSLVLTLCGVLKDILLVAASMMIWGTIVTPLQFIGYAIALGGLVYYKLGGEQVRTHLEMASQRWRSMSSRRPFLWRILMFIIAFCIVYALLDVLAPSYAPRYDPERVSAAYLAAKERYRNGGANIPKDN
ncbi:hypothetical protein VE02_05982 [Pseudogymnoascus sp. 03VT05]|nr:hypothetical protein VE02_05982 [Pseudogymnoascus sp. 03VT05]